MAHFQMIPIDKLLTNLNERCLVLKEYHVMDKNMVGSTVSHKHKELEQYPIQPAQNFESLWLGLCIIDNLLKTCHSMHLTKEF